MKYTQFLELEERLLESNITLDDIKENPEILNEDVLNEAEPVSTAALSGIIGGGILLGLLGLFHKHLIRWGIKKFYLNNLRRIKNNFLEKVKTSTSTYAKKTAKLRQELIAKEKQLRDDPSEEAQAELAEIRNRKRQYDRRVANKVFDFIEKIATMKTKQVHEKIDELKRLKESQKYALKVYWEQLKLEVEMEAFDQLVKDGVITDPELIKEYQAEFGARKDEIKDELATAGKKIKDEKKEGEEGEEGEEEKKEGEITFESISKNIDDLSIEKDKYNTDKLKKKIILIIRDVKKLEDKEERKELYKKLASTFGSDLLKEIRQDFEEESEERPEQTAFQPDEL